MKFLGYASIFILIGLTALGFLLLGNDTAWAQQKPTSPQTAEGDPEAEEQGDEPETTQQRRRREFHRLPDQCHQPDPGRHESRRRRHHRHGSETGA